MCYMLITNTSISWFGRRNAELEAELVNIAYFTLFQFILLLNFHQIISPLASTAALKLHNYQKFEGDENRIDDELLISCSEI
jgi:hypothetical protein